MLRTGWVGVCVAVACWAWPAAAQVPVANPAPQPAPAAAPVQASPAAVPTIGTDALRARLQRGEALYLVDVRSSEAFAAEHLPDAHSLPYAQVDTRHGTLPRDRTLVLYCA